jgi:hypothetical protein
MPLMIQFHDGLACPTVVCDWCQQPIDQAQAGGYFWPTGPRAEGQLIALTFLHKGACDDVWQALYGPLDCWEELLYLPTFMMDNLDMQRLYRPRELS